MIRFIKVRNGTTRIDELINVNHIIRVVPQKTGGCVIFFSDKEIIYTGMSPEEMDKLLFKI